MKKIIAIALALCLACTFAFAADAQINVGGQIGFHSDSHKSTNDDAYEIYGFSGLQFDAFAEYEVADSIFVKAELGLDSFAQKVKLTEYLGIGDPVTETLEIEDSFKIRPLFFAFVGAEYVYDINEDFDVKGAAGLALTTGQDQYSDEDKATYLGLQLEALASYKINNEISAFVGGAFDWYFASNNVRIATYKDLGIKTAVTGFRFFAGASYAL